MMRGRGVFEGGCAANRAVQHGRLLRAQAAAKPLLAEVQLFRCCRVIHQRTRETGMNTNLVRTNGVVIDGWPILLAYTVYVISFCIFATTMTSVFPVA